MVRRMEGHQTKLTLAMTVRDVEEILTLISKGPDTPHEVVVAAGEPVFVDVGIVETGVLVVVDDGGALAGSVLADGAVDGVAGMGVTNYPGQYRYIENSTSETDMSTRADVKKQ